MTSVLDLLALAALLQGAPDKSPVQRTPVSIEAPPAAFTQIQAGLRAADPVRAEFTEEKRIKVLRRPLTSQGELVISSRLGLYRKVVKPRVEEVVVAPDALARRAADGKVERFDLQAQPVARGFVSAFLLVLSGDTRALAKKFELSFEGTHERWSLGFAPKQDEALVKVIASIVVEGRGDVIERIVVTEQSGDVTTTRLSAVVARKALSEEEERQFFGWRK